MTRSPFRFLLNYLVVMLILGGSGLCGSARALEGSWSILTRPLAPGDVQNPGGMEWGADGALYVADAGHPLWHFSYGYSIPRGIHRRDPEGDWSYFPLEGFPQYRDPVSLRLAAGPDGALYVTNGTRLRQRNPQGAWTDLPVTLEGVFQDRQSISDLDVDSNGDLYVTTSVLVRRDPQGNWSRVEGGGQPLLIAFDGAGNLYAAEYDPPDPPLDPDSPLRNIQIRRRNPNGEWSVVVPAQPYDLKMQRLDGLEADARGNVYILWMDLATKASRIERVDPSGNRSVLTTGNGGPGTLPYRSGMAADPSGRLFVGVGNDFPFPIALDERLRVHHPEGGWGYVPLPDSPPGAVRIPIRVLTDASKNLFVIEQDAHPGAPVFHRRDPQGIWTHGFIPAEYLPSYPSILDAVLDAAGNLYLLPHPHPDLPQHLFKYDRQGNWSIAATSNAGTEALKFSAVGADPAGNVYVVGSNVFRQDVNQPFEGILRKLDPRGDWSDLFPPGLTVESPPAGLSGVTGDAAGNVYVSHLNGTIKIDPQGGRTGFFHTSVHLDRSGNLYFKEWFHQPQRIRIRRVDPTGNETVFLDESQRADLWNLLMSDTEPAAGPGEILYLAGNGTDPQRSFPRAPVNATVQALSPGGVLTPLAGQGSGPGQVMYPKDLEVDADGDLYVADAINSRVMKFSPHAPALLYGDLDGNGAVDLADAVLALRIIVGLSPAPTPAQLTRIDVAPRNPDGTFGDGQLLINDVIRLLRKIVGLEEPWP